MICQSQHFPLKMDFHALKHRVWLDEKILSKEHFCTHPKYIKEGEPYIWMSFFVKEVCKMNGFIYCYSSPFSDCCFLRFVFLTQSLINWLTAFWVDVLQLKRSVFKRLELTQSESHLWSSVLSYTLLKFFSLPPTSEFFLSHLYPLITIWGAKKILSQVHQSFLQYFIQQIWQ